DGAHVYERFNPMTGITYEITPKLTAYGGYAEANRAPTPAELACADPVNPCLIESFLTADPNLKQVVSRTFELGLRGKETYCNDAPDAQCANATKGDRLPGVPQNLFKTGMEYWFTPQIKGGFDVVVASNQIFYNDWANTNAPLAGYATVNLHGSYDVTKNVQI